MAAAWITAVIWLIGLGAFLFFRLPGQTPDPVAVVALGIDMVSMRAIWTAGGVLCAAAVTAGLVRIRRDEIFAQAEPSADRKLSSADLGLSAQTVTRLQRRGIHTADDLRRAWGHGRKRLHLPAEDETKIAAVLGDAGTGPWAGWLPTAAWWAVPWVVAGGLIGARLQYILAPPPSVAALGLTGPADFLARPIVMLRIYDGGLGYFGGLLGGFLGLWLFLTVKRLPMVGWLDATAVGAAAGLAVGRWGHLWGHDFYGRPTDMPWAVSVSEIYRLPRYATAEWFHPLFAYEAIWFGGWALLLGWVWVRKSAEQPGEIAGLFGVAATAGPVLFMPWWINVPGAAAAVMAGVLLTAVLGWRLLSVRSY